MERSCPLSRFRPLIPVLLGDLLALGFFPIIHIICLWGERRFLLGGGAAAVPWERRFLLVHLPQALYSLGVCTLLFRHGFGPLGLLLLALKAAALWYGAGHPLQSSEQGA